MIKVLRNTFGEVKEIIPNNKFIGEIDFIEPLKNNKEDDIEKTKRWAKELVK